MSDTKEQENLSWGLRQTMCLYMFMYVATHACVCMYLKDRGQPQCCSSHPLLLRQGVSVTCKSQSRLVLFGQGFLRFCLSSIPSCQGYKHEPMHLAFGKCAFRGLNWSPQTHRKVHYLLSYVARLPNLTMLMRLGFGSLKIILGCKNTSTLSVSRKKTNDRMVQLSEGFQDIGGDQTKR